MFYHPTSGRRVVCSVTGEDRRHGRSLSVAEIQSDLACELEQALDAPHNSAALAFAELLRSDIHSLELHEVAYRWRAGAYDANGGIVRAMFEAIVLLRASADAYKAKAVESIARFGMPMEIVVKTEEERDRMLAGVKVMSGH